MSARRDGWWGSTKRREVGARSHSIAAHRTALTCVVALALVSSMVVAGCAGPLQGLSGQVAEGAPSGFVEGALDTFEETETRDRMLDVLRTPAVEEASRVLVAQMTDGSLAALADEERAARLGEVADAFVERIAAAISTQIGRVAPALATAMSRALETSLERMVSEENRERLGAVVSALAAESASALAEAVREDLAPAMRAAFRDEIVPALREAMSDDANQRALGETTRTFSRELVLGVQDGFAEIQARQERGQARDTIVTRVQDMFGRGVDIFQILLVAVALALVAAIALLIRTAAKSRQREAEAQRREAAILAITEALKGVEDRPWSRELLDHLRASFRDNEHAEYLREILRHNRHLRLDRASEEARDHGAPGGGTPEPA